MDIGKIKLQAAEIKFMRTVVNKARRDRIGKTYIRGEPKVEEVQN